MSQTKKEKSTEEINASVIIDLSVDIKMPRENQLKEKKYKCTCCGASWDSQKYHFSKTGSPLYQSNDGYLPICNACRDRYYYDLVALYNGNEAHAIRHFCNLFDIIFHDDAYNASRQISSDRSRLAHYLAKKNLGQTSKIGYTYIDGLKQEFIDRQDDVIESREQAKSDDVNITASSIDRWGAGFTQVDYNNLDAHYKLLKKNNPNADNNQEIFIKSLANINNLMIKALQNGNSKEYTSLVDQYAKTFKQAGLKAIEEKDSSNDEVFGVTLATISRFTPEEFYKDKSLYADWDKIGEYYERHVLRPMNNIMTGSDIRDNEFFVPESGDDDED